ncbi:MAG: phenylalanine--tRNA ligase subunit beta, partial [Candidatus Omnitrophica bacterium]|nr:phenylalanine--tRNA ligase subunit beta [Candidatus Omnitrophota bacterium]
EGRDGDFVFEIEITSNRPDCLSIIGIAREVAAITGKKLKLPVRFLAKHPIAVTRHPDFQIKIEDKKDCSLYNARIIKDVKVSASPDWIKQRLELVGLRSVNNIVDITNYILFECGEPLHAFDLDRLNGDTIFVRRAKDKEKIITIDGEPRTLAPSNLVIADKEKAVAIAGVMGGKDTEVTEGTNNVLLEAAVFNPVLVRRARQALGVQSESAYRFERGIDLGIVEFASYKAAQLIESVAGGKCTVVLTSGMLKIKPAKINLESGRVSKILGVNIPPPKIKKILEELAFKTKINSKKKFEVTVPSYRQDVKLEIDLMEEIARLFGYENIPSQLPAVKPQLTQVTARDFVLEIKDILLGLGLNEVITYNLIDSDLLTDGGQERDRIIEILNPLSKEQEVLRPALIPSLLRCIANNLNQKQEYVNIFEIANSFSWSESLPKEELFLGIALSGVKSWLLKQGLIKDEVSLLHLKGIVEALFGRLGIKNYIFQAEADSLIIDIYVEREKVGTMRGLRREMLDKFSIKNKEVCVLEVSLERIFTFGRLKKEFLSPPKYPAIARDISFILRDNVLIQELLAALQEKGKPQLREVKIIDYYHGEQIPPGYRGLTISLTYRSDERTLTEAEIQPTHASLCNILTEKFQAKIR